MAIDRLGFLVDKSLMPLRTYTHTPPGGLQYEQQDANGNVLKKFRSDSLPFPAFCREIQRVREANHLPRATFNETKEDVDEANCQRLNYDPTWVQKKTGKTGFTPTRLFKTASAQVRAVATLFSNANAGIKTLLDWGDDGFKPVAQETAQARADICLRGDSGNPCPQNQNPAIRIPDVIATKIKTHIESKNGMKLKVEGEADLNICVKCGCFLKLKLWTPMDAILANTPNLKLENLPDYCWIKNHTPA